MADWFRKSTWGKVDAEDFERRLSRARATNRPQYLRIQAVHLLETREPELIATALTLASRVTSDYPDNIQTSPAHHLAGQCHEVLGDTAAALASYRLAIETESRVPSVWTDAYLDFGWLVARRRSRVHYAEALALLTRYSDRPVFPIQRYLYHAASALIAHDEGEPETARTAARAALAAAHTRTAPFAYHRQLGLVDDKPDEVRLRLEVLAE